MCEHANYDDYFEMCTDCKATKEEILREDKAMSKCKCGHPKKNHSGVDYKGDKFESCATPTYDGFLMICCDCEKYEPKRVKSCKD
jgi:hypothetical protein